MLNINPLLFIIFCNQCYKPVNCLCRQKSSIIVCIDNVLKICLNEELPSLNDLFSTMRNFFKDFCKEGSPLREGKHYLCIFLNCHSNNLEGMMLPFVCGNPLQQSDQQFPNCAQDTDLIFMILVVLL